MEEIKVNVELREKAGVKGVLSAIRAEKKVPAVIYGGQKEPISVSITEKDLKAILKAGSNSVVTLSTPAGKETAIIKEVQYHVVKDTPNHVDFQRISLKEKIDVVVPLKLTGESADVKIYGALINQVLREVAIRALPTAIPHEIAVDISALTIHKAIHISDLSLSKDIEVLGDPERAIVHLMVPREEETVAAPADTAVQPESSSTKGKKDEDGALAKDKK
ncbi:Ribosomal 5S rRNA E-loop binding protein Ctc/L25/TL5 [Elusimicrobium minutum Pei191]|uniref:Large ribosomal subunit protein bL25 n=1 Tax=Elusimicrobium minutum (strain Pei191) TaxID=445932 RepID=RL25_ELUMP|nr:50S ribosomal protein L25 [Elusimicrobium minutum]B2KE95.1 RecName: Full=Large ribosomal subunit protein bL25; AltName: Full=50S ribosomal protein L25; AltName: Full=General stress protein CTC [Elusimicrobium minutum Pei191]ACC98841.1 Ribosomal 5S rRNA E-loop binding protein Ctc/L25/TL5 [Elusimicrobium minutum Pei191]